jgi:uncharacterized membrane protein
MEAELSSPDQTPEIISANPAESLVTCPSCGQDLPSDAAFCPDCKWPMIPLSPAQRAIAAAAYLPLIPAIAILFLPAFSKDRFVRFHAWQSLCLWTVFFILTIAALLFSNVAAAMTFLLLGILASLAMMFLWIVLSLKAWRGERFELPVFGLLGTRMK